MARHRRLPDDVPPAKISAANIREARELFGYLWPYRAKFVAAFGALAVVITSDVLITLDAASGVQPYLPTRYWLAWVDFFRDPIFWRDIERGLAVQACYIGVLLLASWANFTTRDVKN